MVEFVLGSLESDLSEQYELFEDRLKIESLRQITEAVDDVNHRFGKHTVRSATSLYLPTKPKVARDDIPARRQESFKGETPRQRLGIPRLSINV